MKAGIGVTELPPAEQPLREGARQRRRMDPRGGLKTNVKLSISPACHPERNREIVVIRGQGFTLSPHMPRTSPLSSGKEMVGAGSGVADIAEKAPTSPPIYL